MLSAVLVLLTFAACDSNALIRPADSLLTPPLYYDEYEGLVEAFRTQVGTEASFCNPYSGTYRSAIIVEDIDGDSQNEALVFYKNAASPEPNESLIKMHYLDYIDGEWLSSADVDGHGDGVESVNFSDMDGDGLNETVVSWSTSGVTSSSILSLYRFDGASETLKEIFSENSMTYLLLDVDGDLHDDIFYISQSTVSEVAQKNARVIGLSGDSVVIHGEARLDPNVSRYTLTVPEKHADDGMLSVYVDALKGEQQMITEFLYWDSENSELCNPLLNTETMSNSKTFRYEAIASEDINNDGKLDVPYQTLLNAELKSGANNPELSVVNENVESVYLTVWKNYGFNGEEETVAHTLINLQDGYMIYLTEEEVETTDVISFSSQNCWVVYRKDADTGEKTEIYSVLRISDETPPETLNENYVPVIEEDGETVCVYITENGRSLGINEDIIKEKITQIP